MRGALDNRKEFTVRDIRTLAATLAQHLGPDWTVPPQGMEPRIVRADGAALVLRAGDNGLFYIGGALDTPIKDDHASVPGFTANTHTPVELLAQRVATQILPDYLALHEAEATWRKDREAWANAFEAAVRQLAEAAGLDCEFIRELGGDGLAGAVRVELMHANWDCLTVCGYSNGAVRLEFHLPEQTRLAALFQAWLPAG
jgi:hypothetical protein